MGERKRRGKKRRKGHQTLSNAALEAGVWPTGNVTCIAQKLQEPPI